MKKLLSLLSVLTISGTAIPTIIANKTYSKTNSLQWSVPVNKEDFYATTKVNMPLAEYTLNIADYGVSNWSDFVKKYPTFQFEQGNYIKAQIKNWKNYLKQLDGQLYQTSQLNSFAGIQYESQVLTWDSKTGMTITLQIAFYKDSNQIIFSLYGSSRFPGGGSYLPGYKVFITKLNFNLV